MGRKGTLVPFHIVALEEISVDTTFLFPAALRQDKITGKGLWPSGSASGYHAKGPRFIPPLSAGEKDQAVGEVKGLCLKPQRNTAC